VMPVDAVRTAKFVARKQWVVAGADDMFIRVYNHNTMEKIKSFEAHTDYIRSGSRQESLPKSSRKALVTLKWRLPAWSQS